MAFSTQKDFFHVPFMNENVQFECTRECVKLKTYDSVIDDRSWAMDQSKQSKYLSDLVTCSMPVGDGSQEGMMDGSRAGGSIGSGGVRAGVDGGDNLLSKHGGIQAGDSVIDCATEHIAKLEEMFGIKNRLQEELEVSNARLKTANEENQRIQSIMNQKYDNTQCAAFYGKIQELVSAGKLNKSDERELMLIYHKMEDGNKAYDILQAENSYLKRLIEKLSRRVTIDSIKIEPERSVDIPYLQSQVNCLRKELLLLRRYEDDRFKQQEDNRSKMSDKDAENLKAIIKERNALREKCRTFQELERKVFELQKKSKEADHISGTLTNDLDSQSKYIGEMENEMKLMQSFYEEEISKVKSNEQLCKCQLDEMKTELLRAKAQAQTIECHEMEISCLRNEIMRRDIALSDYDSQYKQLMSENEELKITLPNKGELERLQNLVRKLMEEKLKLENEIMRRQRELDDYKAATKRLGENMKKSIPRLDNLTERVERMDQEVAESLEDTKQFSQELEESIHLVKQISDLQVQNKEMEKTVAEIHDREMENLKRLLAEEQAKYKLCQEQKSVSATNAREIENLKKLLAQEQAKNKKCEEEKAANASNAHDIEKLKRQLAEEQANNQHYQEDKHNLMKQIMEQELYISTKVEKENVDIMEISKDDSKYCTRSRSCGKDIGKSSSKYVGKDKTSSKISSQDDEKTCDGSISCAKDIGKSGSKYVGKDKTGSKISSQVDENTCDGGISCAKDIGKSGSKYAGKDKTGSKSSSQDDEKTSPRSRSSAYNTRDQLTGDNKGKNFEKGKGDRSSHKLGGVEILLGSSRSTTIETANSKSERGRTKSRADDGKAGPLSKGLKKGSIGEPSESNLYVHFGKSDYKAGPLLKRLKKGSIGETSESNTYDQFGKVVNGKKGSLGKRLIKNISGQPSDPNRYDQFVYRMSTSLKNKVGRSMEKEVREILEDFVRECGTCFACSFPRQGKGRFRLLCHKVVHNGIEILTFKELLYMHSKIFIAADKILPGCLLNMIVNDYKNSDPDGLRCSSCRTTLCCETSEEILKEKVNRLERDIEKAKHHLDNLKCYPVPLPKSLRFRDGRFEKNLPYCSLKTANLPKYSNKQIKNLKANILGYTEYL